MTKNSRSASQLNIVGEHNARYAVASFSWPEVLRNDCVVSELLKIPNITTHAVCVQYLHENA